MNDIRTTPPSVPSAGPRDPADQTQIGDLGALRQRRPVLWAGTLFGPILVTIGVLAALWMLRGVDYMWKLGVAILVTFFGLGRFIIVLGVTHETAEVPEPLRQFSPEKLFFMVLYMDLFVATILSCHVGVMFRLPWIGRKMKSLVEDGRFILESNPWMRRMTFAGIIAFVTFPLAATGSVGGSIFGRLLGLSRLATFLGVVIGSLIGSGAMYLFAGLINKHLPRDNPLTILGGVGVIVGLIILLNLRYKKMKQLYLDKKNGGAATAPSAGESPS